MTWLFVWLFVHTPAYGQERSPLNAVQEQSNSVLNLRSRSPVSPTAKTPSDGTLAPFSPALIIPLPHRKDHGTNPQLWLPLGQFMASPLPE